VTNSLGEAVCARCASLVVRAGTAHRSSRTRRSHHHDGVQRWWQTLDQASRQRLAIAFSSSLGRQHIRWSCRTAASQSRLICVIWPRRAHCTEGRVGSQPPQAACPPRGLNQGCQKQTHDHKPSLNHSFDVQGSPGNNVLLTPEPPGQTHPVLIWRLQVWGCAFWSCMVLPRTHLFSRSKRPVARNLYPCIGPHRLGPLQRTC